MLTKNRRALKTRRVTRSSYGRANSYFCARFRERPLRVSVLCPLGFIIELEVRLLHQRLAKVQDVGLRLKMYERPTTHNNNKYASCGCSPSQQTTVGRSMLTLSSHYVRKTLESKPAVSNWARIRSSSRSRMG